MSKLNKIFQSVPVKIPDRSGFDLSHESLFTTLPGTITPATCFEVLPGDTFSFGSMMKVTLPPFAVPFMGRVDAAVEAFFVPNRILWRGWQSFITQNNGTQSVSNGGSVAGIPLSVPVIDASASANQPFFSSTSLSHYLGVKSGYGASVYYNALPFLAYHMIADCWYRDENNMKPFFVKNALPTSTVPSSSNVIPRVINALSVSSATPVLTLDAPVNASTYSPYVDISIGLGSLRQRCWAKDYFTTMTTRPQAGADSSVSFDTSGSLGSFTIATLRAANSLQKWLERNNIAGTDYGSQILAHFGVTPPDAVLDKPVLLGAQRVPVIVGSVENNAGVDSTGGSATANPFEDTIGAAAGFGSAYGKDSLCDEFTAKEHGWIMVMFTLVPHAYYDTGVNRSFLSTTYGDYAWPEFASIGDQEVYALEIASNYPQAQGPISLQDIIGYNQRYAHYKHIPDRVAGLVETGENLSVYALKRGFDNSALSGGIPQLGKSFLTIPTDYLDQVSNVNSVVSRFGCIVDIYFDIKALRVLPEYSLPSL